MKYELTGLTVCSDDTLCNAAQVTQAILCALCEDAFLTYDRIVYPYADSLLLAKRNGYPILFGQKTLLWNVDIASIEKAVESAAFSLGRYIEYSAQPVECSAAAVEKFLVKPQPQEGTISIGGFHRLVAGVVTPWGIREHSRRFCSFCEHISRQEGVEVIALNAGYISIKAVDTRLLRDLKKLYEAKTGGIMLKKK